MAAGFITKVSSRALQPGHGRGCGRWWLRLPHSQRMSRGLIVCSTCPSVPSVGPHPSCLWHWEKEGLRAGWEERKRKNFL